jgi:glutathione peroxidase
MKKEIYDISVVDAKGNSQTLNDYRDKVMLVVNVASRCGFTRQYATLERWYRQYQAKGLEILAFPCNQFAGQEPEDNAKIQEFAKSCFATTFPIFAKVEVNGSQQAPIYQYLQTHLEKKLFFKNIPWNFTKYLVNRKGQVVYRFWPIVPKWYVEKKIQQLLIAS